MSTDNQWHNVDVPVANGQEGTLRLQHMSGIDGENVNVPTISANVVRPAANSSRTRLVVAQGVPVSQKVVIPEGYSGPAHYATDRAATLLSEGRNIPEQVRVLARELHPRNQVGEFPQVMFGAVAARVSADGSLEAQVHKSGAIKVFVHTLEGRWKEFLPGSPYSPKGRDRLEELRVQYEPQLKKIMADYGFQSRRYAELKREYAVEQARALRSFNAWNCPPLGKFEGGSRLHKVKNETEAGLDAVVVATGHSPISVKKLFEVGKPSDLTTEVFQGKTPTAFAALVRGI